MKMCFPKDSHTGFWRMDLSPLQSLAPSQYVWISWYIFSSLFTIFRAIKSMYPLFSISPLRSLSPSQSVSQGWERGREGSAPHCGSPATTRRNISGKRWTLTAEFAQNDICGLKVFLLQSQANAIFVHSLWKQWISFVCARIFGWSARVINNQNHCFTWDLRLLAWLVTPSRTSESLLAWSQYFHNRGNVSKKSYQKVILLGHIGIWYKAILGVGYTAAFLMWGF